MNLSEEALNITINTLKEYPAVEKLKEDMEAVYKYQEAVYLMVSNSDEAELNTLRTGTLLAFNYIRKKIAGKDPKNYDKEDWKEILDHVTTYGIVMDPQEYTKQVFEKFADYIDLSVRLHTTAEKKDKSKGKKDNVSEDSKEKNKNEFIIQEDQAKEIKGLADEIRAMSKKLDSGQMTEADYVDRCMWTSFEAMIKLLAAYKTRNLCSEYSKFLQAVADFSVQYGRLALYSKELELLNSYIEGQELLDKELETQYNSYLKVLQKETDVFEDLMEHAFSDDFEERLKNSALLARQAGVSEEMILDSDDKIDAFFMD